MNAQIQTLKAEIAADLDAIAEIYEALDQAGADLGDEQQRIVVAYYMHNLYCAFESIFQRIADVFGNHISDRAGWHADLLRRMTLDIEGIRPHLLSAQAYDSLDELRRFRHVFRSAYRLQLDADRLALVHRKARALEQVYESDIQQFVGFLDDLTHGADA
jgi:hypothetical protein